MPPPGRHVRQVRLHAGAAILHPENTSSRLFICLLCRECFALQELARQRHDATEASRSAADDHFAQRPTHAVDLAGALASPEDNAELRKYGATNLVA